MGNKSSNNGGVIVYVPGGRGRPAETLSAGIARRGETIAQTLARVNRGPVPRNARYLPLSGEDIRSYGGSRGFSDADITDFTNQLGGSRSLGNRLVNTESRGARAGGAGRLAAEETRAAANARRAANRAQTLAAEVRQARARVRQLQADGRAPRTIRQAENAVNRLNEQLRAARTAARG